MIHVTHIYLNLKAFESEFGPTFYSDDWASFPMFPVFVLSLSKLAAGGCFICYVSLVQYAVFANPQNNLFIMQLIL